MIHFLGIGGVGMAGLAYLLKARGETVSGCDKYATPRTRWLEQAGIPVATGHDPCHLKGTDTLVVTPAVPLTEPEYAQARAALNVPDAELKAIRFRGELLAELVNGADGIAVCGTHGKTTTATFTAKLLKLLDADPAWCIGGECGEMPVAAMGTGPLVVEADESDGTLALYHAHTLVVTTLDYDHPEHFKTIEDYRACFAKAERQAKDVIHAWELDASDWPELKRLVVGRHNVMNARAAIEVALRRGYTRDAIAARLPEALSTLPDRRFQTIWPQSAAPIARERIADGFTVVTDYAHHPAELACAVAMAKELKPKRLRVLFQPHRYSRTKALKDEFPAAFTAADEMVLIPVYPAFEKPIPGGDIADLYLSFRKLQGTGPQQMGTGPQLMGTDPTQTGTGPKGNAFPMGTGPTIWPEGLRLARTAEEAWRHVFLTRQPGDLILLAGAGDIINLVPQILKDLGTGPVKLGTGPQENAIPMGTGPKGESLNLKDNIDYPVDLSKFSFYRTGGISLGGGEPIVVGMGSNTWFSDCATTATILRAPVNGDRPRESMQGLANVDRPREMDGDRPQGEWIPAGVVGATLVARLPQLAFMAGIPGTLGGWVKMNAGAFGHSISECVETVRVILENGKIKDILNKDCDFGYRTSSIPGLIIAVQLMGTDPVKLGTGPADMGTGPTAKDYLARRKVFPARTCGSVFKNPALGNPAGVLLEEAGAKKLRVGGASVWSQHANVIVADDGCTSSDILALARLMARAVYFKFDMTLEPEVRGLDCR